MFSPLVSLTVSVLYGGTVMGKPVITVPSKSSIVFSSLATDLSANSARVSAWDDKAQVNTMSHQILMNRMHIILKYVGGHVDLNLENINRGFYIIFWSSFLHAHLFQLVSEDLDLFLILVLFLRVLWWETLLRYRSMLDITRCDSISASQTRRN